MQDVGCEQLVKAKVAHTSCRLTLNRLLQKPRINEVRALFDKTRGTTSSDLSTTQVDRWITCNDMTGHRCKSRSGCRSLSVVCVERKFQLTPWAICLMKIEIIYLSNINSDAHFFMFVAEVPASVSKSRLEMYRPSHEDQHLCTVLCSSPPKCSFVRSTFLISARKDFFAQTFDTRQKSLGMDMH